MRRSRASDREPQFFFAGFHLQEVRRLLVIWWMVVAFVVLRIITCACLTEPHPLRYVAMLGIHRSLGTHVSKVRSLGLDALDERDLSVLREVGNVRSNAIWEHSLKVRRRREDECANWTMYRGLLTRRGRWVGGGGGGGWGGGGAEKGKGGDRCVGREGKEGWQEGWPPMLFVP